MSYLSACIEATASLRSSELADRNLGVPENSGTESTFRQFGIFAIGDNEQPTYVGLKTPNRIGGDSKARFVSELAQICLYTADGSALLSRVPSFMCCLAIGDRIVGILTEDVSEGGQKAINPQKASASTRELLYRQYESLGSPEQILDEYVLNTSAASIVGSEERLLDFTPAPVNDLVLENFLPPYTDEVEAALPELTISIPRDSVLARDILERGPGGRL